MTGQKQRRDYTNKQFEKSNDSTSEDYLAASFKEEPDKAFCTMGSVCAIATGPRKSSSVSE